MPKVITYICPLSHFYFLMKFGSMFFGIEILLLQIY